MSKLNYQFIATYNVYQDGVVVGMGMITRMSSNFYLDSVLQNEMVGTAIEETKKRNPGKVEHYIGDFRIQRRSKK